MNTIALLGDSTFARLNREGEEGYFYLLKEFFPLSKIFDLSSGGANVLVGITQVSNKNLKSGTYVFVMFGTNDAASWKKVPIEEFESTYKKLLDVLVSIKCKPILVTLPPVNTKKQAPPGRSNEELEKYSGVVKALAKNYNAKLIDLYKIIIKEMKREDVHCEDGVHLNEVGYRLLLREMKLVAELSHSPHHPANL